MLECVVNISEGRDRSVIDAIARSAGDALLDVHTDADHHRSVLTLLGESAPRAVARAAVERLDIRDHRGAHPRIGVVDVVPFVALDGSTVDDALAARDAFSTWAADELAVPCFRYGPERTLPDIRRGAFTTLAPDVGPAEPHPTAGAMAVGARPVLVAYNVWLAEPDLALAKQLAAGSQEVARDTVLKRLIDQAPPPPPPRRRSCRRGRPGRRRPRAGPRSPRPVHRAIL